MNTDVNPSTLHEPGTYFWEDYANTNRLCVKLDFVKAEERPISKVRKPDDNVVDFPKTYTQLFFAYKYAGPKGKGIQIMPVDHSDQLSYKLYPYYATVENGNEVPWKGWTNPEEALDFHAFHIKLEDKSITDYNNSYGLLLDSLISLLYDYSGQVYTIQHLMGLSDYEKLTFIKEVVDKNKEIISDLIIA